MLQNEECTASEAAYGTGFGSPAYFNKCFHEFYGYPPGKLRKVNSENHGRENQSQSYNGTLRGNALWKSNVWYRLGFVILAMLIIVAGILISRKLHGKSGNDDLVSADGRFFLMILSFLTSIHGLH